MFAIQEGIAQAIVQTLDLRLAGAQNRRLVRDSSVNLEAYSLYLKGRYGLNTAADAKHKEGHAVLEEAIAKDSSYSPAYAGLGDSYDMLYNREDYLGGSVSGKAEGGSEGSRLDPTLPEAIATQAG